VPEVSSDPIPRATIADVYDQGAAIYAAHWAPVLQRHARDLAALVPPPQDGKGRTVLDVAAGAGTLLTALRPLVGDAAAGGRLVALDYSAGMLALSDPSVPRVQSDAAALPLRDECADVAMYSFVLFLLPDARAAVTEAARVLRPGGWLLAATWGNQVGTAADDIIEEEVDAAGAPPGPDLPRSDELTDTPDRMRELLEPSGFADITTTTRPLDAQFDAATTLALRTGMGNLGWRYRQMAPLAKAVVRELAVARMATLGPEDFLDRSQVLLTTARRA
jgi:SAM-dependent methyltransferase